MDFYAEPAFFVFLIPIVLVAIFCGVRESPLERFGCAASLVMLALLFFRTPMMTPIG